ncbi:MAG: hypothetical protein AVDCRST_MAG87-1035, partial [uncultured Thermomicrobiales bacterium]
WRRSIVPPCVPGTFARVCTEQGGKGHRSVSGCRGSPERTHPVRARH